MKMDEPGGEILPCPGLADDQDMAATAAKAPETGIKLLDPGRIAGKGIEFRQKLPADDVAEKIAVLFLFALMALRPAAELAGEILTEVGIEPGNLRQEGCKIGARETGGGDGTHRPHIRGTGLVGEDRPLAKDLASAELKEIENLSAVIAQLDPHRPPQNKIEGIRRIFFGQNDHPGQKVARAEQLANLHKFPVGKSGKDTERP